MLQEILMEMPPERNDKLNKKWFDDSITTSCLAIKKWLDANP